MLAIVIIRKILLNLLIFFQKPQDLAQMIVKVLKLGLEGLVLKDINVSWNTYIFIE